MEVDGEIPPQIPDPVTRKVNVKTGAGRMKVMGVVREHYLRTDIPCLSELCFEKCQNEMQKRLLPKSTTHYLIPMEDVVSSYFEILEFPDLSGMIFLQSVVNAVQVQSLRKYRKICDLLKDERKSSVFFPNEFSKFTSKKRKNGQSVSDWRSELAFAAANWYYEHLGGQKPIILLTEDKEIVKKFGAERVEVFVMTLNDYLKNFWPNLTLAHEALESISDALKRNETEVDESDDYAEYLKPELLEAGIRMGKFIKGNLNVNKYHSTKEAFVLRHGGGDNKSGDDDILIAGMANRNRAVHGDIVAVQLLPKSEWKSKLNKLAETTKAEGTNEEENWEKRADVSPTGKIVGVLERNWGEYVATLPREEGNTLNKRSGKRILVYPYDYRIPKVRILTAQARKLVQERIVVRIDSWPVNSKYPNGHFVRSLGKIGDLETELDGILLENNIAITPFSQGILSEMPNPHWSPSADELADRKDLRSSHLVMSIDPKGCEDVDDTLSIRKLTNGNIELGVHIADVTHFVPFNSLTDQEARRRATTVYLADRRYDMLPSVLSSNLCSLLGGQDRFAVSVLWELDSQNKVVSVWYGRTYIRSAYKLAYEDAQDIIDGTKTAEEIKSNIPELQSLSGQGLQKKFKQLRAILLGLSKVAQSIQDNREKKGALKLESAEVQFEFKSTDINDMKAKEHLKIHETVAECMIFANHWVAKKISKAFPDCALLRRHPPPKKENFEELKKCASSKGWRVAIWGNRVLSESLNECNDPKDPMVNFLMRSLATYAMVQALYFSTGSVTPEDWEHYGLALTHYTHFTSPIRRYADIIVHRLLLAALEKQDWWTDCEAKSASKTILPNNALNDLSQHINDRNRAAQNAQRSSQILFQTLYFKDKKPDDPRCIVDAVIFSIRANGFLVYIPRYALKGPVFLENKEKQVLFYKKNVGPFWTDGSISQADFSLTVTSGGKKQEYRLFDHVTVTIQMQGSDAHPASLVFYLLSKNPFEEKIEDTSTPGQLNVNFMKEIQNELEDLSMEGEMMEDLSVKEKKDVNRNKPSMYNFFLDMKKMGSNIL